MKISDLQNVYKGERSFRMFIISPLIYSGGCANTLIWLMGVLLSGVLASTIRTDLHTTHLGLHCVVLRMPSCLPALWPRLE